MSLDEICATGLQLGGLVPQRADGSIRVRVQLDFADIRLGEADGQFGGGFLRVVDADHAPEAVRAAGGERDQRRGHGRERRPARLAPGLPGVEERAVDDRLQSGQEQRSAEVGDLGEGQDGHQRHARIALE